MTILCEEVTQSLQRNVRSTLSGGNRTVAGRCANFRYRCIPVNQLDTRKKAFEAALKLAMFE